VGCRQGGGAGRSGREKLGCGGEGACYRDRWGGHTGPLGYLLDL